MRFSLPIRLGLRGLAIAGLLLVGLAATASAHFYDKPDHRWPWLPYHHELQLKYYSDCTNGWAGNADAGADAWSYAWNAAANDWAMPVYFVKKSAPDCSAPDLWRVNIRLGNKASGALAWAQNYDEDCFLWECWWDAQWDETIEASNIRLNTHAGTFGSLNAFDRQLVVVHELGHSLGLKHNGYYAGGSSGYYSVMDYCCPSYNTPRQHDINDINALYPGW